MTEEPVLAALSSRVPPDLKKQDLLAISPRKEKISTCAQDIETGCLFGAGRPKRFSKVLRGVGHFIEVTACGDGSNAVSKYQQLNQGGIMALLTPRQINSSHVNSSFSPSTRYRGLKIQFISVVWGCHSSGSLSGLSSGIRILFLLIY